MQIMVAYNFQVYYVTGFSNVDLTLGEVLSYDKFSKTRC